ncbi:hypothetical protein ABPG72_004570 [Tetrahymena utriculariae]
MGNWFSRSQKKDQDVTQNNISVYQIGQDKRIQIQKRLENQQNQISYSNQGSKNHYDCDDIEIQLNKKQRTSRFQSSKNEHSNQNHQIQIKYKFSIQAYNLNDTKQDQEFQDQNQQIQTYIGIQNKQNTCYINSALQMLRQIYEENKLFLEQKSNLANILKCFFLEFGQGYVNQQLLHQLIIISKQKQQQQINGGDSYLTAFNYLSIIINDTKQDTQNKVNEYNLTQFQQIFTIIFQDGLICQNCNNYQKKNINYPYIQEADSSLDLPNFPKYSIESVYEVIQRHFCYQCNKQSIQKSERSVAFFPQFLIVKLPIQSYQYLKKKIKLQFNKKDEYQLIGYCNYIANHYTYTAKKKNKWINYNDFSAQEVDLNLSQSVYQLYKKV